MRDMLVHAHSGWRWIVLILILAAIAKGFAGTKKQEYSEGDRKLAMFAMISFHIQWLIGLVLYFISPMVSFTEGFMKDTVLRFYAVEHIVAMTIVMALITIGHSKSKKKEVPAEKYKTIAVWYTISLIIILLSIPWPFRIPVAGWM